MSGWNRTASLPTMATDPVNTIPTASERKPRNRDFEKKHPKVSYRISDENLPQEILVLARSLTVSADEVSRAFVEAGLQAVQDGRMDLSQILVTRGRMSLYPIGREQWVVHDEPVDWSKAIPTVNKKRGLSDYEKSQQQKTSNRLRVHYRWPNQLIEQINDLYCEVMGSQPVQRSEGRKGQLITMLLRYGIEMYKAGRLPLVPQPVPGNWRLP